MKIVSLVLATAVAAVIGSAPLYAQSAGDQSGNSSQSGSGMNAPTHPDWQHWDRDRDWYRHGEWQRGRYGHMGPWMMGPHAGWMMGPRGGWMGRGAGRRHRHPRGAHFVFQRGNARIDIQCPANQSVKDCVSAASTLIDKVSSMNPPPGAPQPPVPQGGSKDGGKTPADKAPSSSGN